MTEQPDFIYFECPDCGFDSIQRSDFKGSYACPLCAGDSGHDVAMLERVCREEDTAEGFDARKGTRAEQLAAVLKGMSPAETKEVLSTALEELGSDIKIEFKH